MRIVVRFFSKDRSKLPRDLMDRVREIKNGILFEPEERNDFAYKPSFLIPIEANEKNSSLLIDCMEYRIGNTGVAICGLSGKQLKPYNLIVNGEEATLHFAIPAALVKVSANKIVHEVEIVRCVIKRAGERAWIEKSMIWEGDPKDLPEDKRIYKYAIKGASEKSCCYPCAHIHYGITPSNFIHK